jgi:CRP/FNR family transcriptional regulator, cyclic AMP receptor protein
VRIRTEPIAALWRITLFAGLSDREVSAFSSRSTPAHFEAGSVVVEEGANGLGFFVIESGKATVSVDGRQVRQLGPGDHFGEIALIADTPRTATITADLDTRCHTITRSDFRATVESSPAIAWKLLENLARALVEARQQHAR